MVLTPAPLTIRSFLSFIHPRAGERQHSIMYNLWLFIYLYFICVLCILILSYYTEGVFITPKVFLRVQDEHDVNSMCIYFRYLAVCITLIAKPTCIYFRFSAVNITLIDIFLSTLLHLAGYFLIYLSQLSSFQC